MNFSKSILLIILICFSIPSVTSNFTVLKNLLSVFRSSPLAKSAAPSSAASSAVSSPANQSSVDLQPAKTLPPIDHHSISAEHLESANQRSALISEDDHKLSPAGLFGGNFISHLQEMIKRRSVGESEPSAKRIVNIEDVDEEKEPEDDEQSPEDGLIVVANSHNDDVFNGHVSEADEDDDDDEEDDELTSDFHKKSIGDSFSVDGNDLKLPPRSKVVERFFDELSQEMKKLAALGKHSNATGSNVESNKTGQLSDVTVESSKTSKLNETAEQEIKQNLDSRDGSAETHLDQVTPLNQTATANQTAISNQTVTSNQSANQTAQPIIVQSPIKSFFRFDNSTNTTSYTYLSAEQTENSEPSPAVVNTRLLIGNTLESLEKILEKYKFLNLYAAPTINDTLHDRDLHQKDDPRVILKANFADWAGYANTEKSPIYGQTPPVQNLTDITYGNVHVLPATIAAHNSSVVEDKFEDHNEIIRD